MSENTVNSLNVIAQRILDALRSFMNQVMEALNVLKKLPEMIRDLRKDMNDGFSNLIQAQAEMEIYIRMAQMKSKKSLILSENEAISDFENQLKEDFNEIDKRYAKLNGELDEECKKRIFEIDRHLLEIPDKFPHDLYSVFSKEIIPLFENLLQDSNIAYEQRLTAIKIAADKASAVVNNFLEVRNKFFNQIEKFEIPEKVEANQTYYLPIWVAEIKNKKHNSLVTKAFLPGKLANDIDQQGDSKLPKEKCIKLAGLKTFDFIEDTPEVQKRIINNFKWNTNVKYKAEITNNFRKYFEGKYSTKYSSAKNAVAKAIYESNLQTIK